MRTDVVEVIVEKCSREKCFGNMNGRCYVLTDTSGQDTCRFYREDLSYEKIMRETMFKEKPTSVFFADRRKDDEDR